MLSVRKLIVSTLFHTKKQKDIFTMLSLDKTNENTLYRVLDISLSETVKDRLSSLGLIPYTEIIRTLTSPCGGLSAYLVRGSQIAIRREYAEKITVERISG